jgi:hypothetical protein
MLTFGSERWNLDVGYNFWGQSCEELWLDNECPTLLKDGMTWALKGDSHVYGFDRITPATIALAPSQSRATICKGTNNFVGPDGNDGGIGGIAPTRNPGIDNPQFVETTLGDQILDTSAGDPPPISTINSSFDPIFLSNASLDLADARVQGMSHSLFAHISYIGTCSDEWVPSIGVGGKVEFGVNKFAKQDTPCTTPTSPFCPSCQTVSLSQWALWLRAGITWR